MLEDKAPRCDCGYEVTGGDKAALLEDIRRHAREAHGIASSFEDALLVVLRSQLDLSRAKSEGGTRKRRVSQGGRQELTREGTRVRFAGSIHVPEDELCFFTFEAPSSSVAALAAQRAGLEPLRVVEAVSSGKENT